MCGAWFRLRYGKTQPRNSRPFTALLLFVFSCPRAPQAQQIPWEFEGVSRIVAIGDVHGAYDTFVKALRTTGLVDKNLQWIGGDTHLVQTGDVLDRGPESKKAIDLLMTLEPQAESAGGRMHALIGNHEFWNAVGDLRYVSKEEFQAFAGKRDDELRVQSGIDAPRGALALREAYGPDGKYGRWIRGHNAVIKIGDAVFVHGGITPEVAALGLAEVNRRVRADLDRESWPSSFSLADHGPLMTRRYSADDLTSEETTALAPELGRVLEVLGARVLVIGHTTTFGLIEPRFDGRAVLIDTGMLDLYLGGRMAALVIEGGRLIAIHENGAIPLPPSLEGEEGFRYVEAVSQSSPGDAALDHWLALARHRQGSYPEAAKLHQAVGVFDREKRIPYAWRRDAGETFAALGEKSKSEELYRSYLEELERVAEAMGPFGAPYWNRYARECLRLGLRGADALEAAVRAATEDPRNRPFKATLAWAYLENADPRRAVRVLTAAKRLEGEESFEAHFLLGRAHLALGDRDAALQSFRKAQRLEPENREAQEAIARLTEGARIENFKNVEQARQGRAIWGRSIHRSKLAGDVMKVDLSELQRRFSEMPQELFCQVNREELTEAARGCYDQEAVRRSTPEWQAREAARESKLERDRTSAWSDALSQTEECDAQRRVSTPLSYGGRQPRCAHPL